MSEVSVKLIGELLPVIVSAILVPLLGFLGKKLADFISTKTKNEAVKGILLKLDHAAVTVVQELSQTMADKFKEASADGKLSPEESQQLKDLAISKLKSYLSLDEVAKLLSVADVQSFLASKIESAIVQVKQANPQF
jgi:hypothetical protein